LRERVAWHDWGVVLALNCSFYGIERVDQSHHIAHIDATIPVGRQRLAGQEMDVGIPAANKQDSFSGPDAGVDL
jgi:hypothetical protein